MSDGELGLGKTVTLTDGNLFKPLIVLALPLVFLTITISRETTVAGTVAVAQHKRLNMVKKQTISPIKFSVTYNVTDAFADALCEDDGIVNTASRADRYDDGDLVEASAVNWHILVPSRLRLGPVVMIR